MGRYTTSQTFADGDDKLAALSYDAATGGKDANPELVAGKAEGLKVPKVDNVMGSNAGSGSGDFHTYRAHRRREYFRQKKIAEDAAEEEATSDFKSRMDANRIEAEERTAKRAHKRRMKKLKQKAAKQRRLNGEAAKAAEAPAPPTVDAEAFVREMEKDAKASEAEREAKSVNRFATDGSFCAGFLALQSALQEEGTGKA